MFSVKLSNGREFSATPGASLLDAASSAGITLPHSCKTGRCSTCKCKVLQGETVALQTETGLTDAEKAEGWILSCVRSAQTDVTLKVEDLGNVDLPTSKTLPCRISSIDRLATDVIRVKAHAKYAAGRGDPEEKTKEILDKARRFVVLADQPIR